MHHAPLADYSRRNFLVAGSTLAAASWLSPHLGHTLAADDTPLPRVAAINTIYRLRSHAYHIAGRFIHGYSREGKHHQPPFKLVRMYNDQYPESDTSRDLAKQKGFEIANSVAEALGGPGKLDVDAVLLIAEHGDYPVNDRGQILYPRYELYQQIVEVFRSSGSGVPVFNDKHLSYDHRKAARMVEQSRELKFGLMAGSSLPVTWRRPEVEFPLEAPLREGLVCYGGSVEPYFFHALETLQCMLERRRGGETGVKRVECLQGAAVWKAGDAGRWSWPLLRAALSRSPSNNYGDLRENVAKPIAILVEYRDGTRGTAINLPEQISDFNFAAQLEGQTEPVSLCFYLPSPPGARYFDALTWNIEKHFSSGKPPYPVERTLLTSTMLDWAMQSLAERSQPMESPSLDIRYKPPMDSGYFRGRYTDA